MLGWLKRLPLIGRLGEVPPEARREAWHEIATGLFWSTMPFWFLPLVGGLIFAQAVDPLGALRGGELFIYSATLLGPLAYVIHKQYGRFRSPPDEEGASGEPLSYVFPYGRSFTWAIGVCCILSGFVFSVERLQNLPQLINIKLINERRCGWEAWGNQADESYRPTWDTYGYNSAMSIAAE